MESPTPHPLADWLTTSSPANDDCARIPVMRPQRRYRRLALRHGQSRGRAAALLVTLALCVYWVGLRPATPAEVEAARLQLSGNGPEAMAAFDAASADQPRPSLLRLYLLRRTLSQG